MFPKVQISPIDLKFNKESNEHGQKGLRRPEDIVSGLFPVLEATYARKINDPYLSIILSNPSKVSAPSTIIDKKPANMNII